jgi:hypothetical protein
MKNLVKIVAGQAAIQIIASAIDPDSIEWNMGSSDFGQIKIGNTRFDTTGGARWLPILVYRLLTMTFKSSASGQVTELNTGKFGAKSGFDVAIDTLKNKASPAARVVIDRLEGENAYKGGKPTVLDDLQKLYAPMPYETVQELLNDPDSANVFVAELADLLGISVNTFSAKSGGSGRIAPKTIRPKSGL